MLVSGVELARVFVRGFVLFLFLRMSEIKVSDKVLIGGSNPCFIVAEVGQNHQGDINVAKQMIKEAKECGADCVKFQKTCIKEKFTSSCLQRRYENLHSWGSTYGEHKRHLEFSEEQFKELVRYANEIGIIFAASAMDMVSFDFLVNLQLPFIKIGSGDSNNVLLMRYVASKKVPLLISTGMIDKKTVESVYSIISETHKNFCLLHCVSAYPTPPEDCNLMVIQDYKSSFDVPIGYSGHENGISISVAAVALGAKVIERHFTLDKRLKGTDHVCSLTPDEFRSLVQEIRVVESALGHPIKKVVTSELPCINKLQKSVVMATTKQKGEIIYPGDLKVKVADPKGLDARYYDSAIYKTLVYTKREDDPLLETDFC